MKKHAKSLLLVLMSVLLLVLVSSRLGPEGAMRPASPQVTDDPLPSEDPVQETDTPAPEVTETPKRIRELLPGLSLSDWNLKLVNNTHVLPNTFAPNVVTIRDDQYFDERAAEALGEMLAAAEEAGFTVCIRTAYRPYATQAYLFNGRASQIQWGTDMTLAEAEQEARKVVAYPGTSEHQLGLCADLMDSANTSMTPETAVSLPVLKWLSEHCAEYGFIPRYPQNKQEITGWWEPWHFRYVGQDAAEYMMEHDLCLEEFVEQF